MDRFLVAIVCCVAIAYAQRIEISGRILDSRGNPLPVAHAELRRAGRLEPLAQVQANPDGSFALEAKGDGLFLLRLAGIHHRAVDIPVIVESTLVRERVTVHPPTLPFPETRDSVLFTHSGTTPNATEGKLIPPRKVGYILAGVRAGDRYRLLIRGQGRGVVTASTRDSLILAPDGYYVGILRTDSLVFDPAELPRPSQTTVISCQSPQWQEIADAYHALMTYQQAYADSSNAALARSTRTGTTTDPTAIHTALGAWRWRDTIVARLANVRSQRAEQCWLLFALALPARDKTDELHTRALQLIPPSSPLWALEPQLVFQALANRPEQERRQFLDALIETNPDTTARAVVAFSELVSAFTCGDRERARSLYAVLTKQCPTHPLARTAQRYNPDRRIQRGVPLPEFRLPGTKEGTFLTRESFTGKPLLVAVVLGDCQPCVEPLRQLAQWRDSTKRSLRVLVISVGKASGELAEVLKQLPHEYSILPSPNAPELELFEVEGFPTFVLTDARGTIRATNQELRNLRTDVGRYLDEQP